MVQIYIFTVKQCIRRYLTFNSTNGVTRYRNIQSTCAQSSTALLTFKRHCIPNGV